VELDDIYVVTDRRETASATDVTRAEHELGCRLPTGYAEYVQRLGRGSLNDLVRVMLPGQITAELGDWQERMNQCWFWDDPESDTDQDHVLGAVPVADTEVGDDLCFHPDDPDTVIVLPRDSDRSYAVGPGLDGAIDWVFASGVLHPPCSGSASRTSSSHQVTRRPSNESHHLDAKAPRTGAAPRGRRSRLVALGWITFRRARRRAEDRL
jgi:SMI1 / KNR4 family (SUKH-1)